MAVSGCGAGTSVTRPRHAPQVPAEVPVSGLRQGDVVKVLPGAQVPVDGRVL